VAVGIDAPARAREDSSGDVTPSESRARDLVHVYIVDRDSQSVN